MVSFGEKVQGALYGLAIGDAMGAPVEGWTRERIAERFTGVEEFLPVTHNEDPASGKGDGRITDDTLMAEALVRAYIHHEDHMDSYDFEKYLIPEMAETKVWIPELQKEAPILERLYWPEKYPWIRIAVNKVEPRAAGAGNLVNCGVAMYMMPAGAVNAGDPVSAYEEAASLGIAHNESFAVEAGAVMAASCARAFGSTSTIHDVLDTALQSARDGTRNAIRNVLKNIDTSDTLNDFITKSRNAVKPYDPKTRHVADDEIQGSTGVTDAGRPSRIYAIEELPAALGALKYGDGDFNKTLHAAVFYGRDCDSIAGMAATLYGALYGVAAVPEKLCSVSDSANRRDFNKLAQKFTKVIEEIVAKDAQRFNNRKKAVQGE